MRTAESPIPQSSSNFPFRFSHSLFDIPLDEILDIFFAPSNPLSSFDLPIIYLEILIDDQIKISKRISFRSTFNLLYSPVMVKPT